MHKVLEKPNSTKVVEIKEQCTNPNCPEKGERTLWVYDHSFSSPSCKHCSAALNGKNLIKFWYDRLQYYSKKEG